MSKYAVFINIKRKINTYKLKHADRKERYSKFLFKNSKLCLICTLYSSTEVAPHFIHQLGSQTIWSRIMFRFITVRHWPVFM